MHQQPTNGPPLIGLRIANCRLHAPACVHECVRDYVAVRERERERVKEGAHAKRRQYVNYTNDAREDNSRYTVMFMNLHDRQLVMRANCKRQIANGKWKMANGKRQMANGKSQGSNDNGAGKCASNLL
jgi:hypothetical protein